MAVIHWGALPMDSQDAQFPETGGRRARRDALNGDMGQNSRRDAVRRQTCCIRDIVCRIERGAAAVPSTWPPADWFIQVSGAT